MKKKFMALLLGTSLALAACGGDDGSETSSDLNEASTEEVVINGVNVKQIYNQKCSSCHGGNLEGGFGPQLSTIGASLSKEDIMSVIENGQGQMPKGIISGDESAAVSEWLASMK
ncbi:cytochrome C551 [Bacillus coahuilensis m2-6]|uniref:cytochrome c551 n=1 Tax=Bacillus coahuilensis TaxID=408580 RepID=UPI000185095E|nr:cytochrome c [Bacillus coahuilensis]KUP05691.1 cytochrome C551 [Bacillus coahuilensis m2-6]